jgi:Transposase domain (DUF772).
LILLAGIGVRYPGYAFCFESIFGLFINRKVPDATTIRLFRKDFVSAGIMKELFASFDAYRLDNAV